MQCYCCCWCSKIVNAFMMMFVVCAKTHTKQNQRNSTDDKHLLEAPHQRTHHTTAFHLRRNVFCRHVFNAYRLYAFFSVVQIAAPFVCDVWLKEKWRLEQLCSSSSSGSVSGSSLASALIHRCIFVLCMLTFIRFFFCFFLYLTFHSAFLNICGGHRPKGDRVREREMTENRC